MGGTRKEMQRGIAHERTAGVDVDTRRGILYSSALGNELLILSLSLRLKREREPPGQQWRGRLPKRIGRRGGGRKANNIADERLIDPSPFSLRRRRRFYQLHLPATPCSQLPAFWFAAAAVLYSPVNQPSSHRFHPLPCKPTSVLCRSLALSKKKKRTLHPALFIYSFHPYFSVLSKNGNATEEKERQIYKKSGGKSIRRSRAIITSIPHSIVQR